MSAPDRALRHIGFLYLGLGVVSVLFAWQAWSVTDYPRLMMYAVMSAAWLVFGLHQVLWQQRPRPLWADVVLGAVLAYFVITGFVLFLG